MEYEYEIYYPGNQLDVAATFKTKVPLPHIDIGNHLILESRDYSTKPAPRLEIADVEVLVVVSDNDKLRCVKTMIYLRERERTPQL